MPAFQNGPDDNQPLGYFYDFIQHIREKFPEASYLAIVEEIAFARAVGPALAGLRRTESGAYELLVPIGYGKHALVELEFDGEGALQPVLGGIFQE